MVSYPITPEKREYILEAIQRHFEAKRPYLTQGYSLRDLSEDLNIAYTYLSFIINREFDMSFNDLINKYRIDHMKSMIGKQEYSLYTLEGIAFKSGFNSRSTFYRAFYKSTGQIPSAFVKDMMGASVV